MRRRYKTVEVAAADGGFAVTLDGKPMRTPAGHPFVAPTRTLADAVAEEWRAQGEKVDPRKMPMTQFVATALDRVPVDRERIVGDLAAFAETDLLCHWAADSEWLVKRHAEQWQPLQLISRGLCRSSCRHRPGRARRRPTCRTSPSLLH